MNQLPDIALENGKLPVIFPDDEDGRPPAGPAVPFRVPTGTFPEISGEEEPGFFPAAGPEFSGAFAEPAAGGMLPGIALENGKMPVIFPDDEDGLGSAPAAYSHAAALAAVRMGADGVNADQMAQDAALGRKLDMPHDMIAKDRPAARRLRVEQDIKAAKSQTLLEWLNTPYNAGIAGDDVSTLEKWLGVLQSTGAATSAVSDIIGFGARASRHASQDYDYGIAQQRLAAQAYEAIGKPSLIPKLREEQKRVGEQRKTDNWLDEHLLRPMFQTGLPFIVEGTKEAAPGAVAGGAAAAIAGQLGPQAFLPEEIITVPVAAAVGAAMSSSEWMMRQEAGAMFMELLEEADAEGNPLDPEVAGLVSLAVGMVNSAFELVGAKGMSKAVAPLAKMFTREGLRAAVKQQGFATAAKGFIKQYGQAIGTEVGTEMAQELVSILGGRAAQNINAAMYDVEAGNPDWIENVPGRLLDTGIETLGAFGLFMLPGPLTSFHARVSSANRGNAHHTTMRRAIAEGEKSKTRQRDANAYEDLAVSALPENMRRQYIDAGALQSFFQSAREMDADSSMAEITERLGIDEMEFAHAIETGGVVSMDTAKYLAHLSPDEQRQLLPDLKADPLAMSQREYASRDFTAEARDLVRTYTPDMERAESLAREKTRLVEEMTAAGRDAHQAEADASIFMAHAVTWETLYGRDAYDGLERMRRLTFVRGEEGATADLQQAAMDRSTAASFEDFLQDVRAGKKEYRLEEVTPDKLREHFGIPDLVINTPYYFIQHLDNSRGKKADAVAAMAMEVMARADIVRETGHSPMGGTLYSAVRHNADGTSDLVTFTLSRSKKKGNRVVPYTAYSGPTERVMAFVEQKEKAATSSGTGGASGVVPKSLNENELRAYAAFDENIDDDTDSVNGDGGPELFQGALLPQRVLQSISSADTSIRQVASALKKISWREGTANVDIGGGRFDEGTKFLAERGVENLIFDPFNRGEQHNRAVVDRLKSSRVDSATATNVLNVIREKDVRLEVIRQAAKAVNDDGAAYFQIYEGDASGRGKETSKGWQNNAKTEAYLDEVRQYFGVVNRKGNLIEAREPMPGEGKAVWVLEGFDGPVEFFQKGQDDPRGAVTFSDSRDIISLFQKQDASTVAHEGAHIFLRDMEQLAARENAPEALRRDYALTREYLGLKEGEGISVDAHEKFARSFEAYLREGVAPSFELAHVFHNFRAWLLNLYKSIRGLGVELTPEIRGVFDRMLATDEQLAEVAGLTRLAEEEGMRLASLREYAAIGEHELDDLNRAYADAHRAATNAMDRATLREFNKRRRDALEQAKAMVDAEPVYMAAAEIRKNPDKELRGISYDHLVENYSRLTADEIRSKFPGVVNKSGGLGADVICTGLGYESGDALVYALADAEKRGKRVNDLAEQIMREHDELVLPDQAALASDSYGAYLEKFQAALSKTLKKVTWSPREYLRKTAKDYARALPVREATRYDTHQHTMRQQMSARMEAAKSGDVRTELMALEKLRLAHEMVGEAVQAREQVSNLAKRIQRIVKSKSIDNQMRDQVLSLAERFDIGTGQKPRNPEHLVPLDTILQGQVDEFGWAVSFPPWLTNGTMRKDYRDLSMFEFGQLDNLVKHLEKRGRDEHRESKASYAARIGNVVQATVAPSAGMKAKRVFAEGGIFRKLTDAGRSFFASMDSLQFQFRSFDNYSNTGPDGKKGPNERLLWETIVEGSNARKRLVKDIKTTLEPHLDQLRQSVRAWEKKYGKRMKLPGISVPESMRKIGRGWSADAAITMALHMGSESNMARLRSGYPDLDAHTIESLTGLLSEKDWDAVQGIWDTLDAQWGRLDEVHFKINGFHMEKIPARPFMPVGLEKQGVVKKYRGGYFPAIYDPQQSRFMREAAEADNLFSQTEAVYQVPAAKKGMTQSRKNKAPGLPLLLSTSVISKHVQDVATYITMAMPVREADRVTRDPAYETAFTRVFGRDAYDQIRPNLKGIVRPEPVGNSFFDQVVEKARSYATPFYLAWNLKTAISQFLSAPRGAHDIGMRDYARGLKLALMNNPLEKIRWIMDVSPFMEERAFSRDRELAAMVKKMDINAKSLRMFGKELAWEDVVNAGFTPMIIADWITAYPIWLGKYESALEKNGGDMNAAVLEADEAVRFSQSTANAEDMSDFLRSGKGFKRMVSMFGTDNIGRYGQRQRYHYRAWRAGQMSTMGYAWFNTCEAILPAVGMRILLELFWRSQPVPDGDDEKGWLDFLADVGNDVFLQGVPLIGNLFSGFRKPLDSPLGAVADRAVKSAKAVGALAMDPEDEAAQEKALLGLAEVLSIASKVPVSQIFSRARRGDKQYEDGDATPFVYLIPEPKN